MQLVYFASVREAIGKDGEEYRLPDNVATIAQCLDWLSQQSEAHRAAFSDREKLRFALDQNMAQIDADMADTKELAIFPPVTGG